MTSFLTVLLSGFIILFNLVIGFIVGYFYREIVNKMDFFTRKVEELPKAGVTTGSYGRTNEYSVNQGGNTGIVTSKTPQMMEFEEQEAERELLNKIKK